MRALITVLALIIGLSTSAVAQNSPYIVSPDGTYLGNLNRNTLDPNSVHNPLGRYGSSLSPDSINNPLGRYGSTLSPYSANNPLATNPPRVYAPNNGYRRQNTWGQ
jgi:hypothetical protein